MTAESIGYGIVGAGYLGKALARGLAARPGARIVAIFDPGDAQTVATEFGARVEPTLAGLLVAADVDAVVVASPNAAHYDQVVAAARAGKHVFCEKPVALSYRDADDMIRACEAAGTIFFAGHVTTYMAGVRRAKEMIAAGLLGEITFVRAVRTTWEGHGGGHSWKKQTALSGGHLYHHIHELDLVQSLLGPATRATMVGGNVAHHHADDGDEADLLAMLLEFDGARFASLEYGSAFHWPEHHVLIQGTEGAIRLGFQGEGCTLRIPGRVEHFPLHRTPAEEESRAAFYRAGEEDASGLFGTPDTDVPLWLAGILDEETESFHRLITTGILEQEFAPLADGSAARSALATADALTLSLQERRTVDVAEVTSGHARR